MPSTIPYDPSLVLASVVSDVALDNVVAIASAQGPVDAAQDALNSLIASRRSLDMTKTELKNLGVDTAPLDKELENLNKELAKAAAEYATEKVKAEPEIRALRGKIRAVNKQVESPIDYLKTEIKTMPLAADTMNMDVQYFNFDSNSQTASSFSSQIAAYVSSSVSNIFQMNESLKMGTAASAQVSRQMTSHNIEGTLVLSVACTHKNANILAPFVLDVDKAIKCWNHLYPKNKLDPTSRSEMTKIASMDSQEDQQKFSIISGTTFGSSFVGMVHVLNTTNTRVGETLQASASNLMSTMTAGNVIARYEGKVGIDAKFASDVKDLLSQQNVTSHVTLLSMGVIPSMVANEVANTVQEFNKESFNPAANMAQVNAISSAVSSDRSSIASAAEAARTGGQASDLQGKAIEYSLSSLAKIDTANNKILDINSMMTALEDYLKKASTGDCGVPINYYLKDIDQKMLAEMWAAKYFPGEFLDPKFDDSGAGGPPAGGSGGGDASGGGGDDGGDAPKAKL